MTTPRYAVLLLSALVLLLSGCSDASGSPPVTQTGAPPGPAGPCAVVTAPDGSVAWVAWQGSGVVTAVDPATGAQRASVTVGGAPKALAITPDGRRLVVSRGADGVSVVDTSTLSVVHRIPMTSAGQVTVSNDGAWAVVGRGPGEGIAAVDLATGEAWPTMSETTPPTTGGVGDVALVPDSRTLLVSRPGTALDGQVDAIDVATGATLWSVFLRAADQIVVAPDGRTAYVTDHAFHDVAVLDLVTHTFGTPVRGARADAIALDPTGRHLVLAGMGGTVTVVDTATGAARTTYGAEARPQGVAVTADGGHVVVAAIGDGRTSGLSVRPLPQT